MKLKFKNQPYQGDAVKAVVDCFKGQPPASREAASYRLDPGKAKKGVEDLYSAAGFRNAELQISDADVLKNIQDVQRGQNLPISEYAQLRNRNASDDAILAEILVTAKECDKLAVVAVVIFDNNCFHITHKKNLTVTKYTIIIPLSIYQLVYEL